MMVNTMTTLECKRKPQEHRRIHALALDKPANSAQKDKIHEPICFKEGCCKDWRILMPENRRHEYATLAFHVSMYWPAKCTGSVSHPTCPMSNFQSFEWLFVVFV